MFTWGSKYFFGLSAAALIGAIVAGLVTGGDLIGVLSAGYKGGIGDHLQYTVLLFLAVATFVLGVVSVITRDADAEEMASIAGADVVPPVTPASGGSYLGALAAFGMACLILGAAFSGAFLALGLAVLFVAAVQWVALAWADRATGDPEVNEVLRTRVMGPFEIPMMAILVIAVVAVGMSRVFLAASEVGAVVAGGVVSVIVFGVAVALSKIDTKPGVISSIVAFGAVAVLAAGIISAVIGPRDFHHAEEHGDDHSDESVDHDEEGE